MPKKTKPVAKKPSEVFGERMRHVRERTRGWTQQQLADRLADMGAPTDRATLARVETRARGLSLDDAITISAALGVSPTMLFTTRESDTAIAVAPDVHAAAEQVRAWARGQHPLEAAGGGEGERRAFFEEIGDEERAFAYHVAIQTLDDLRQGVSFLLDGGTPDNQLDDLLRLVEDDVERVQREVARVVKLATQKERV